MEPSQISSSKVVGDHLAAQSRSNSASELQAARLAKLKEEIDSRIYRRYPTTFLVSGFLCRAVRECAIVDSPNSEGFPVCSGPGLRTGELVLLVMAFPNSDLVHVFNGFNFGCVPLDTLEYCEDVEHKERITPDPIGQPWRVNPRRRASSELMKALSAEFKKILKFRSIGVMAGVLTVEVCDDGQVKDFEGLPEWIEGFPVRYSWAKEVEMGCGCDPRCTG